MADEKDWPGTWDVARIPFCFVPHGAPEPTEWMTRHPGWFKIPATFVPRGAWPPASAAPAADEGIRVADRSAYRSESRPLSKLRTSDKGKEFIFMREAANPEITKHTHWPGYASGVTIGPGYDMKLRTREQIVYDLMSIGVDQEHARALAAAGTPRRDSWEPGLTGEAAKEFAERHATDVTLTLAQQRALLDHVISIYEADVRRLVHVPLTQDQFDALVSFDYNKGVRHLREIVSVLNKGDYEHAASILQQFDNNGLPGLQARRRAEAAKFRSKATDDR